jgi:hypothetical protein
MKDVRLIFCDSCGGEAEFTRTHVPFCWPTDWVLVEHGCDADCANHPDADPRALLLQVEEDEVRQSEKNFERTLSGDHGPLPLREQLEQARRLK